MVISVFSFVSISKFELIYLCANAHEKVTFYPGLDSLPSQSIFRSGFSFYYLFCSIVLLLVVDNGDMISF